MDIESPVDDVTRAALDQGQVIDLTTTGHRTGQLRRIEIFLHNDIGHLYMTGMPRADRTRDWIHNIGADPHVATVRSRGRTGFRPSCHRSA